MKTNELEHVSSARFLNLHLSLSLNPFGRENKIKMKIMIKRGET